MGVGGPLEEAPQVVAVGVQGPAAVPGQVGSGRHLALVEQWSSVRMVSAAAGESRIDMVFLLLIGMTSQHLCVEASH